MTALGSYDHADFEWQGIELGYPISVLKVGGGTVGKTYTGRWVIEWLDMADEPLRSEIETGTPKTHAQVAKLARDFYLDGVLAEDVA